MQSQYIGLMHEQSVRTIQLCQPKTILVTAAFNAGELPQGTISLETRLDDVVAYRLKTFNGSLVASVDWDPATSGDMFVLRSSTLASNRNHNLFMAGLPTGISSARAIDQSNIIGYLEKWNITSPGLSPGQGILQCKGNLQALSRPLAIEQFDWSINLLNNAMPVPTAPYTMSFAIEFYSPCQCQFRMREFGSSS